MPELLAGLLPAAAEAGGEALLGGALGAGADAGAGAALGGAADFGLSELAAAGLPFAAGAGEVGSVAAGAGAASLPFGVDLAAAGLPFAAGAGEIGTNVGGTGVDLGALLAGTGGADGGAIPANATPTSGGPISFGGISSVGGGPVGSVPSDIGSASFANAPAVAGGPSGAVAGVPGVSGAAGAASAAPPAGAGPLDLTSLLGKAGSSIANNPLGLALAAGGLGYNIFKGQSPAASTDRIVGQDAAVKAKAGEIMGQGQGLASHVEAGTLPPALQQQLDSQIKDAKTKIISTYAANGMNTDPKKNSMLQQELTAIDKNGLSLKGEMEKQLLASGATLINSGTALVGADNDLIKTLSSIDQKSSEKIGSAIANFAAALSGKSNTGLTVNLGGEKKAA